MLSRREFIQMAAVTGTMLGGLGELEQACCTAENEYG